MDKLEKLLFKVADAIMDDNSRFSDEEVQALSIIFRALGEYLDLVTENETEH
tara:strand:- start:971 stop:1126 length:156 start_codon:yes stop_codon:yes gene_type:complete